MSETRRGFRDHSLYQLTLARFRGFVREPEAVFWTFVFPILMASGLGIAFRQRGPDKVHVGVLMASPRSDTLLRHLGSDSGIVAQGFADSAGAKALRSGKIALLVVPGPNGVRYVYDPARSEAGTAKMVADRVIQTSAGRTDPIPITNSYISEKGSRYIDFVVPGLLGMNLMGSSIWGLGFAIVTARNQKLLKRMMATPMSRAQYLLSFLLSRLVFLVFEVVTLLAFAHFVFGVPLRGSLGVLGLVAIVGSISFGTLGLLLSSRATTTEGVSGLMNFVMLPMWIFSGVFFSSANFPAIAQPLIRLLPLTAVNDALRANMLEGATLAGVAPQLLILFVWMVVSFTAALKLFRWR